MRGRKTQVRCVETGALFESITEAARYSGETPNAILRSIQTGTALKGFHYEYSEEHVTVTFNDIRKRNLNMRKDREAGMTLDELAAKYGMSAPGVRWALNAEEAEKKRANKKRQIKKRNKEIVADVANGLSYRQTAKRHGVSEGTVWLVIKESRAV